MAQHFLLSTKARTLSLATVLRLSDDEAYAALKSIRFTKNNGEPFCPKCGCVTVYEYKSRRIFKCKGCQSQFSLTSGTIFASRKLEIRDILAAIAIFVNGANDTGRISIHAVSLFKLRPLPARLIAAVPQSILGPSAVQGYSCRVQQQEISPCHCHYPEKKASS